MSARKGWPRRRKTDLAKVILTAPVPVVGVLLADRYGRKWPKGNGDGQ